MSLFSIAWPLYIMPFAAHQHWQNACVTSYKSTDGSHFFVVLAMLLHRACLVASWVVFGKIFFRAWTYVPVSQFLNTTALPVSTTRIVQQSKACASLAVWHFFLFAAPVHYVHSWRIFVNNMIPTITAAAAAAAVYLPSFQPSVRVTPLFVGCGRNFDGSY